LPENFEGVKIGQSFSFINPIGYTPKFSIDTMRIIEDDALKFLEREIKRGNKYDCLVMDPPKFGRGPKGEIWKMCEL
jgi:hypothetical protein